MNIAVIIRNNKTTKNKKSLQNSMITNKNYCKESLAYIHMDNEIAKPILQKPLRPSSLLIRIK